ncbi:MAG: hypothetical protein ABI728_09365 [Betaproteobacteria bacterium]
MKRQIGRLWPFAAAVAALSYLIVMLITGALPENRQIAQFEATGLLAQSPEGVNRIEVSLAGKSAEFSRQSAGWATKNGAPVEPARAATLERALKIMHNAGPVRVMAPEEIAGSKPESFGFASGSLSVTISGPGGLLLQAEFGNKNTDGMLQYMRLKGRGELYLMSGFVGKEWEAVLTDDNK